MDSGILSLKWNNHQCTFHNLLHFLRKKGLFTDVILACGKKFFHVHKLVLIACSDFFKELFEENSCQKPVVVLNDVNSEELNSLLDYMYLGQVDVPQSQLPALIKVAERLSIKGLAVVDDEMQIESAQSTAKKRKRHVSTNRECNSPKAKSSRVDQHNNCDINKIPGARNSSETDFQKRPVGDISVCTSDFIVKSEPNDYDFEPSKTEKLYNPISNLSQNETSDTYVNKSMSADESHTSNLDIQSDAEFEHSLFMEFNDMTSDNYEMFSESEGNEQLMELSGKGPNEGSITCEFCLQTFTQKGSMKRHIKDVHYRYKSYECNNCQFKTARRETLMYHISSKHSKKPS